MNGTDARKAFGKTTKTVERINVRTGSITCQGIAVRLQILDSGQCRLIHVLFIKFQTHCVRNELMRVGDKTKIVVEFSHGHLCQVASFVRLGLVFFVLINVNEKLAETAFLKETHERRTESLIGSGWYLENLAMVVDVGTHDGLELQVSSDLGMKQAFW